MLRGDDPTLLDSQKNAAASAHCRSFKPQPALDVTKADEPIAGIVPGALTAEETFTPTLKQRRDARPSQLLSQGGATTVPSLAMDSQSRTAASAAYAMDLDANGTAAEVEDCSGIGVEEVVPAATEISGQATAMDSLPVAEPPVEQCQRWTPSTSHANAVVFVRPALDAKVIMAYWRTAMLVPREEQDQSMPCLNREQGVEMVKYFDDLSYECVSTERLFLFSTTGEPYQTFRKHVHRLSHERNIRLAIDASRYQKVPAYFRWNKWGQASLVGASATTQESTQGSDSPTDKQEESFPMLKLEDVIEMSSMEEDPIVTPHPSTLFPDALHAEKLDKLTVEKSASLTRPVIPLTVSRVTFGMLYDLFTKQSKSTMAESTKFGASFANSSSDNFVSVAAITHAVDEDAIKSEWRKLSVPMTSAPVYDSLSFPVDNFALFQAVWEAGGLDALKTDEEWKNVCEHSQCLPEFHLASGEDSTMKSQNLYRYYKSHLYEFEVEYRKGVAQKLMESQPSSSPKTRFAVLLAAKASVQVSTSEPSDRMAPVDGIPASTPVSCTPLLPRKRAFSFSVFPGSSSSPSANKKQAVVDAAQDPIFVGYTPSMVENPALGNFVPLLPHGVETGHGTLTPSVSAKTRLLMQAKKKTTFTPVTDAITSAALEEETLPIAMELNLDTYHAIQEEGMKCLPRRMRRRLSLLPTFSAFANLPEGDTSGDEMDFDLFKVNLDNFQSSKRKFDRLESKMNGDRSLTFWNEFGFGVDYNGDVTVTFHGLKNGDGLRKRRGRVAAVRRGRPGRRRRGYEEEEGDSADSESTLSSESDMEDAMEEEELAARFCPSLEPPEITLQKEQELEIFLLSFGPTKFLDPNDETGKMEMDTSRLRVHELRPIVDVQGQQLQALRQRHNELKTSYRLVRREMKELKLLKKVGGKLHRNTAAGDSVESSDVTPCPTPLEPAGPVVSSVPLAASLSHDIMMETSMMNLSHGATVMWSATMDRDESLANLSSVMRSVKSVKESDPQLPTPASSTLFSMPTTATESVTSLPLSQ